MLSQHDSLLTHSFWGAAHGTNPSSPPLCALPALWDGSTQRTAPRRSQEASPPLPGRSASSHGAASIILIAMATQHPPPRSPPPHKAAFGTAGCQRCTFDTLSPPREVGAVKKAGMGGAHGWGFVLNGRCQLLPGLETELVPRAEGFRRERDGR